MTTSLKAAIRTIPDYPKPGIMFRDVTTLMGDAEALSHCLDLLLAAISHLEFEKVAGIEARGFVFGAMLAGRMNKGFVPVRKKGKLPAETVSRSYALEYGEDNLEIHTDAINKGMRVLLIDDLIATGGTAIAAAELVEDLGGIVAGAAFVVDLPELGGTAKLQARNIEVIRLLDFEGA